MDVVHLTSTAEFFCGLNNDDANAAANSEAKARYLDILHPCRGHIGPSVHDLIITFAPPPLTAIN